MESRVELFAAIRRDSRVEDLSIRELADRHHVHRRTVRQALTSALPRGLSSNRTVSGVSGPARVEFLPSNGPMKAVLVT